MNESNFPQWVPASLVRIRCFLNRRGMKVKPWLGPQAVLDAFYAALQSQTHNDDFWIELEQLLQDLAADMNRRIANRGWTIQNELLDQTAHAELLTQIRQALGIESKKGKSLHQFTNGIPRAAGALLLMLAAAIVVGCDDGASVSDASDGGTGAVGTGIGGAAGAGGVKGTSVAGTGGTIGITLASTSTATNICPDTGATSGLDATQFAQCNQQLVSALIPYDLHSNSGKQLLECVCLLNDAWQTGLAELFAGQSCDEIAGYFGSCGISSLCATPSAQMPPDFDADLLVDSCSVVLYLGVRCD